MRLKLNYMGFLALEFYWRAHRLKSVEHNVSVDQVTAYLVCIYDVQARVATVYKKGDAEYSLVHRNYW